MCTPGIVWNRHSSQTPVIRQHVTLFSNEFDLMKISHVYNISLLEIYRINYWCLVPLSIIFQLYRVGQIC